MDEENIAALKAVVRSQLTELVAELGMLGGPRVARVDQYFQLLIGNSYPDNPKNDPQVTPTDPDLVGGTLGSLRDILGLNFRDQDTVNTVTEEQNLSNFRILSDYVTSLAQSWINNLDFFGLESKTPFYGTQLVLISRQLSVVAESVDEVRFTLDSVFIGPAERQTLQLTFKNGEPAMFAEDLYNWIQSFAAEEGPRLIQDGGKFAVQNTFVPVAARLLDLVTASRNVSGVPRGYHTARVQRALQQLEDELRELVNLAQPIRHVISAEPEPSLALTVIDVDPDLINTGGFSPQATIRVHVQGSGFLAPPDPDAVKIGTTSSSNVFFRSEGSLIAEFLAGSFQASGTFDLTVQNPDLETATLKRAVRVEVPRSTAAGATN